MNQPIYLDNNATTGLDPSVVELLQRELHTNPQNPSSVHHFGQHAKGKLQQARSKIAQFFELSPAEVIFTASGTEGLNLVLRGVFTEQQGHVISSVVEHSAVHLTLQALQKRGVEVTLLPVGEAGFVTAAAVAAAIRPNTRLITLIAVNNETGIRMPIEEIAAVAEQAAIPLLVDGVAWLGKEQITLHRGISAICFSGHKIHAPLGVGLLLVRKGFHFPAIITGGGQELARRSGTENLWAILGLAQAIQVLTNQQTPFIAQMQALQRYFEQQLLLEIGDVTIHGKSSPRVCNTINVAFHGIDAESLLMNLDQRGVAASHGSACSSGALEPSRILLQMGIDRALVKSSLRFSLSRFTTQQEIDATLTLLKEILAHMH